MRNFKTVIANLRKWKCGEVSFLFAKIIEHTEVEKNLIYRQMYVPYCPVLNCIENSFSSKSGTVVN